MRGFMLIAGLAEGAVFALLIGGPAGWAAGCGLAAMAVLGAALWDAADADGLDSI